MSIESLLQGRILSAEEWIELVTYRSPALREELRHAALETRIQHYGHKVYLRGLIELTNFCRCDCTYCGIRRSNRLADRYRLTTDQLIDTCRNGYRLGYRTFVLQGGEDNHFTDDRLLPLIRQIKQEAPEAALTLSLGERSKESYQKLFDAGADRYLLRHETASETLYAQHHPGHTLEQRIQALQTIQSIGFQTGAGFLVGLPGQIPADLAKDLSFISQLRPAMVGIGPFIPHSNTPLASFPPGDTEQTIDLLAIVRLLLPKVLLPATTALATLRSDGREQAFRAGANVVMPNLTPPELRPKYALYEGKKHTENEAAEQLELIHQQIHAAGFEPVMERGDSLMPSHE